MAYKAFYKTKDEIPEEVAPFYKQQADGRYKYDADDVEDVTGLKSALEHEREDRRNRNERYSGIDDPDRARELLALDRKGELDKAKGGDDKDFEELLEKELGRRTGKLVESKDGEIAKVSDERDRFKARLEALLIDQTLTTEATQAGVRPEALPDVLRRGRERFYLQDESVVAKDSDGNILYGADGKSSQSPQEFMDELKGGARHLFQPSNGGGASRDFTTGHSGAGQGNQALRGVGRMRAAHANGE